MEGNQRRADGGSIRSDSLESIVASLPPSIKFNAHLDATINLFCATLVVNAKLQDIAIFQRKSTTFGIGRTESNMIQERAGGRLGVFDKEFACVVGPNFSVATRYDLGLERNSSRFSRIVMMGPVGEATNAHIAVSGNFPVDRLEME